MTLLNQANKSPQQPHNQQCDRSPRWYWRPPWRTLLPLAAIAGLLGIAYLVWQPGRIITDGSHDPGRNAIWIQHGWLGADEWFIRQHREAEMGRFRDPDELSALATRLRSLHITQVYPHLCPCTDGGRIAPHDSNQTERFLDAFDGISVMPWVGGVLEEHALPASRSWREAFAADIAALLDVHPRLAGIHINIEPWPDGNTDLLQTLEAVRGAMPPDRTLSVAAYPPPTLWHRHPEVHWCDEYFAKVAGRCDQMAVMMYDTSLGSGKFYTSLMADWTETVLRTSGNTEMLLGVPVYDDAGVGYHHPNAENLTNALRGIHAGLDRFDSLPENYSGAAIYCEWQLDIAEETIWRSEFLAR